MKDVSDSSRTNGLTAFADGEFGSLFKSDGVDEFDGEGNMVTRHNHIGAGRKSDRASDIGGAEEELWTIAV